MSQKKKPRSKRSSQSQRLQDLSNAVGDFIRYWGFRRIHGQLWTQIYLSKEPLSGAELMRNLAVSKALVSPALAELENYNLIQAIEVDGRTKRYKAHPDVFKVIRDILKNRERKLILEAQKNFEALNKTVQSASEASQLIDVERLQKTGEMISMALVAADLIIHNTDESAVMNWNLLSPSN